MADCVNNIGTFEQLDNQVQNIILKLLENENICKLIYYNTEDALTQPPVENPTDLIKTHIYTQTYIPPTDEETTYLVVFFDMFDSMDGGNVYLRKGRLYFNVVTHRNLWNIDGGQRVIRLMNEIDKIINKNNVSLSLTKDFFKKANYRPINETFNSYDMLYTNIGVQ